MIHDCDRTPPASLLRGIEEFNRGEYFECHETLERIWMREPAHVRRLYQGILQVGVGLYHLRNGNYRGTLNLLASAAGYLRDFSPQCMGVDVEALVREAAAVREQVEEMGPERFRAIRFSPPQIQIDPAAAARAAAEGERIEQPGDSPGHW